MNTAVREKFGTLTEFSGGRQHVVTNEGEHFWLTPNLDAALGAKVGDRIRLEYHATPNLGLWYGEVVPVRAPVVAPQEETV